MSETLIEPTPAPGDIPPPARPNRRRLQVGLWTLFLLIAAIAVWVSYLTNQRHIISLEAQIKAMQPLAHELIIEDPSKIAVVKLEEMWSDDNRWDVSLPDGLYRICLATREINDSKLAPVAQSEPLAPGRHRLILVKELDKEVWRVTVSCDGKPLLTVAERKAWEPGLGSTSSSDISGSQQMAADKNLVLTRIRFMRSDGAGGSSLATGPAEGILLWIEPVEGPKPPAK